MIYCECGKRYLANTPFSLTCKCGKRLNVTVQDLARADMERADKPPREYKASHWLPLHQWAAEQVKAGEWDAGKARLKFAEWCSGIPSVCNCRERWADYIVERGEPDYSSANAYLDWTISTHNDISLQHANNPVMSLENARRVWLGPKVAWLSTTYARIGGTETFHRTLLPRLRSEVNIIGFCCTDISRGDPSILKVPYFRGTDAAAKLATEADIVVTWGIDSLDKIISNKRTCRVISINHADSSSDWSSNLQKQQCIDEVVCVNLQVAEQLRGRGVISHYIPNAIDPNRVIPSVNASSLRTRWGIPTNHKIVLWAHRFSAEKRPELMLEIAGQLPDGYTVVMAGSRNELKSLPPNVRNAGQLGSLADWLSVSSCFVSLSTFEGFGLSVGEAMLARVPVVSTATGIANDANAYIVDSDKPRDWVDAIINCGPAKELAHEQCASEFGIDAFVSRWKDVICTNANARLAT